MSMNALRAVSALFAADPPLTDLTPTARAVLWVLADAADADGYVWLGSTALGLRAGMDPGNARRMRARLVAGEYLFADPGRKGRKTRYRLPAIPTVLSSTTRVTTTRLADADPRHHDAGPASPRRGTRVMTTRYPGFDPGIDPARAVAVDDDTPPAFTDDAGARDWARRYSDGAW